MNARKIYDEADVLGGILDNKLFLGILGAEAALQVRCSPPARCPCFPATAALYGSMIAPEHVHCQGAQPNAQHSICLNQ